MLDNKENYVKEKLEELRQILRDIGIQQSVEELAKRYRDSPKYKGNNLRAFLDWIALYIIHPRDIKCSIIEVDTKMRFRFKISDSTPFLEVLNVGE